MNAVQFNLISFCLCVALLLPMDNLYAAVVIGPAEVKDSPGGEPLFSLNDGVGVQVLEASDQWTEIYFRTTNLEVAIENGRIKEDEEIHAYMMGFTEAFFKKMKEVEKETDVTGQAVFVAALDVIGRTLKSTPIEILPMGPPETKSGYVVGYIKSSLLRAPKVTNIDKLKGLEEAYYYRLDYVDLKAKTYDIDVGWNSYPIFCDFRVKREGNEFRFAAGNFREVLSIFSIDNKGNVTGDTCFDTFCIENITIETTGRFSINLGSFKQEFISTSGLSRSTAKNH